MARTQLMADKRNVYEVLNQVTELWSPQVVGEVNDYDVKAPTSRATTWNTCTTNTDEIFLVLAGRLHLDLPDHTVTLDSMDVFTVPRGVRSSSRRAGHSYRPSSPERVTSRKLE